MGIKRCPRRCDACNRVRSTVNDPQRDNGNCEDDGNSGDYCRNHSWACSDSRYPWFKELYCRKTCGTCNEKVQQDDDRVVFKSKKTIDIIQLEIYIIYRDRST